MLGEDEERAWELEQKLLNAGDPRRKCPACRGAGCGVCDNGGTFIDYVRCAPAKFIDSLSRGVDDMGARLKDQHASISMVCGQLHDVSRTLGEVVDEVKELKKRIAHLEALLKNDR